MNIKKTFKVEAFYRSDKRGFTSHKIIAYLNGDKAGEMSLSNINSDFFDKIFHNNPLKFRYLWRGAHDINLELIYENNIEKIIDAYQKQRPWIDAKYVIESEIQNSKESMEWSRDYFCDKVIVENIEVKEKFRRMGVATSLYIYAVNWLRDEFGLKLFKSSLQTDEGKAFYQSSTFKKTFKLKKVNYDSGTRYYFVLTKSLKDSYKTL